MEYVRTPIEGEVRPVYVVWELTLRCDLACGHCGSRAGKARARELSTDEALDLVEQLAAMGSREVTLIGGEAYLRDDWATIVRAIRARGMRCTMTSGARAFGPERARLAREAGLEAVSVSLDGLEATHDRQRGVRGSFAAALESARNLRAAGVPITANTQVNRLSLPELPALLDLLVAEEMHAWQVQLTVPMGRAADHADWLLQPWELLEAIPLIARLKSEGLGRGVRLFPGNNVGYFGPHEATLRGDEERPAAHAGGCGAGRALIGIEADGAIKGCPSLPTSAWVGGNVRERPRRELWETRPLRYTRDRTVEDLWGFCRTCYYADTCRAGCTWTSHVWLGRPGNNPYCHHRALEHASKGLRERLVQVERAPGEPFDHGRFEIVVEPANQGEPDGPRGLPLLPASRPGERGRLPVL